MQYWIGNTPDNTSRSHVVVVNLYWLWWRHTPSPQTPQPLRSSVLHSPHPHHHTQQYTNFPWSQTADSWLHTTDCLRFLYSFHLINYGAGFITIWNGFWCYVIFCRNTSTPHNICLVLRRYNSAKFIIFLAHSVYLRFPFLKSLCYRLRLGSLGGPSSRTYHIRLIYDTCHLRVSFKYMNVQIVFNLLP